MTDPAEIAIRAGERAASILRDDVFLGAVEGVRRDLMASWRESAPEDVAKREEAWRFQYLLDAVVSKLRVAVEAGVYEAERLEYEQRQRGA